jgi:DNA (cytosine-5)-methyltransferase 1
MRLLDLFCGAGGAAMGYHMAGWEVVGVDIAPQPNFPFEFHQADALTYPLEGFDAIHASPPCQGYTRLRKRWPDAGHPLLIAPMRERLKSNGRPYVMENVEDARPFMEEPILLCGSTFGLRVQRHRLFEMSDPINGLDCDHDWQNRHKPYRQYVGKERTNGLGYRESGVIPVYGGGNVVGGNGHFYRSVAMGIDWMTTPELNESIPPAFTRHVGRAMTHSLEG